MRGWGYAAPPRSLVMRAPSRITWVFSATSSAGMQHAVHVETAILVTFRAQLGMEAAMPE